ncbi:GlcG/HbpS family heme-binding protein [Beijerinckia indica]|uniref:Heme-binding protein n=1 Tax=Beijerinckia indica subsp. indica (strain ATCC 9039 / DSM 1715 / NCIMB 8712) TaxID=395963 RepID=B2IG01_BEII9|nr:heme-binding protein [Beijerinckia indica]ACB95740.1 protein of unknown function DUF336 [Beijerinckia indica subsp. indica ATCC 9039]
MRVLMRQSAFALILSGLATPGALAAGSHLVSSQKLDWETATKLASEAVRICAAQGYSVTAAVVDPSGHQQAVVKGDTVPLQSLSVSYRKAYTAFSYGQAFDKNTTSELINAKLAGPENGALNTIPEVLFVPGGVTLRKADHRVIGGLGVSGAPGGDKDEACAKDAVAELQGEFQ